MDHAIESIIIQKLHHVDDRIDIDESNLTPIQEFYKDSKVFVTGFTGFLGQLLVEKLLRSCPVSTIYVLMRQKKGKDIDVRLQEILDDHLFSRMKKACPGFRQKVVPIEGDCDLPDLGLSDEDKKVLIDGVSIVFHIAATVRFEEKLKTAVIANIRATRDMTFLARQMSHLKSFVYVSTAYANCFQDVLEERICPANIDYQKLIVMSETIDGLLLEKLSADFRGRHANTYTYTKQIAENVVKTEMRGLPTVVYRPAIVLSTFKEPIRGWCNNLYGATGIFYAASLGILRVVRCDQDIYANIIPADMCINGMIACAWDGEKRFQEAKEENGIFELPVYNYESTNDQPITWGDFKARSSKYGAPMPSVHIVWTYYLILVKSYSMNLLLTFLLHTVPASIADAVMFVRGKKMRFLNIYKKIHEFSRVLTFFVTKSLKFKSANVRKMLERMSVKDREVFFCDLKQLDWEEFVMTYGAGIRVYLVKDPMDTVDKAKRLWRRYNLASRVILTVAGLLAATILWSVMSTLYRSFLFVN